MNISKWNELSEEQLTVESIQSLFQPADAYRISRREFPVGTEFPGTARSCKCFVIQGKVRYASGDESTLSVGDVADLPSGRYTLTVLGDEPLVIVRVWKLSDFMT